jgi:hypothetical protein
VTMANHLVSAASLDPRFRGEDGGKAGITKKTKET